MSDAVRRHYETHPYPSYPLLASLRRGDTYALNLETLWARFNGTLPPADNRRILMAGCGSFAPYPFALANPAAEITALDLSRRSLRRARLHCLLHGRTNVSFEAGDLLDPAVAPGPFALIDAYGVLHHLDEPLKGLGALAERLARGGILRVMLYSRYARRQEESIRRAFRLLGVKDATTARRLLARARPGSRLERFCRESSEVSFNSGLADALLHPCVRSYRIGELMELVAAAGLTPLLFAHGGALPDIGDEVARLRALEERRESPGNFVLFLGRDPALPSADGSGTLLLLNPCLRSCVGRLVPGTLHIPPRLGHPTPPLGRRERAFLRRFTRPVPWDSLDRDARREADIYRRALFLLQYRP